MATLILHCNSHSMTGMILTNTQQRLCRMQRSPPLCVVVRVVLILPVGSSSSNSNPVIKLDTDNTFLSFDAAAWIRSLAPKFTLKIRQLIRYWASSFYFNVIYIIDRSSYVLAEGRVSDH